VRGAAEQNWRARARCRGADPELFHPGRGEDTTEPKRICAGCAVREPCLDYALANGERFGIWGGLSERERRRLRRQRRAAA
jgi:WhiB family redox-sensing transcriptional regulator